jgi:hypothetical protein
MPPDPGLHKRFDMIAQLPEFVRTARLCILAEARGGLVRSDRICDALSGIVGAIKLPILSLAA